MPRNEAASLRVSIAGASGLVGQSLTRLLSADTKVSEVHLLLRRDMPQLLSLPKVKRLTDLPGQALPPLDMALCALGTTIKAAGSQAAFRAVDHDAVLAFAEAARRAGATVFGLVSALGADPNSAVFYNRIKGGIERAVGALGFDSVVVARPSLLLGDRAALGQPTRLGERIGQQLAPVLSALMPRRLRPIKVDAVAQGMLVALRQARSGLRVVESDELLSLSQG